MDGEAVAAVSMFYFAGQAIYLFGMSRDEHREKMPNYLLQWEAMRRAKALGCRIYNLWGAPDEFNESDGLWGVFRFKEGLGGYVLRTIGAWDFTPNPLLYKLYTEVLPRSDGYHADSRGKARTRQSLGCIGEKMIPRIRFAHLPTPIETLPRLTEALNGPRLLVKRDDQTGLAFGGNKTRKLEFLVAEAQAQGADTLLTAGALQSNHCRQTAAAAAKFGFDCILVLVGEPPAQPSANLLLDQLFGAKIIWTDKAHRDETLAGAFDSARLQGKKPYLVPYGGSNSTGALGYVFAMEEFIGQGVQADWIVFASSSGGTQAGLVLGARLFGFSGKILGISVDEPQRNLQNHVAKLASETSERLGPRHRIHCQTRCWSMPITPHPAMGS